MAGDDRRVGILVVDDHPVIRLGLRVIIESQPDLRVVAEADSVESALRMSQLHQPDLVVLPLRLEGELTGIELCRELVASEAAPRVLVYTSYNAPEDATASFLSGAHSFVHKTQDTDHLLDAIRATMAGRRTWLLGAAPAPTLQQLRNTVAGTGLTRREQEVLGLMLQRLTNAQIARELFVELPTVKTHVRNILAKLGIGSRRDLF